MSKFLIVESQKEAEKVFPLNEIKKLKADGHYFCLVRTNKGYKAFEMKCPHLEYDLSKGKINSNHQVVCPWHDYTFQLESGEENRKRCNDLTIYPLVWEVSGLYITI